MTQINGFTGDLKIEARQVTVKITRKLKKKSRISVKLNLVSLSMFKY